MQQKCRFLCSFLHIFILLYKNTLLLRVCFSRHVNVSRQLFSKMKFPAIVLTISKYFTVETLLWPLQKILRQAVHKRFTLHSHYSAKVRQQSSDWDSDAIFAANLAPFLNFHSCLMFAKPSWCLPGMKLQSLSSEYVSRKCATSFLSTLSQLLTKWSFSEPIAPQNSLLRFRPNWPPNCEHRATCSSVYVPRDLRNFSVIPNRQYFRIITN